MRDCLVILTEEANCSWVMSLITRYCFTLFITKFTNSPLCKFVTFILSNLSKNVNIHLQKVYKTLQKVKEALHKILKPPSIYTLEGLSIEIKKENDGLKFHHSLFISENISYQAHTLLLYLSMNIN